MSFAECLGQVSGVYNLVLVLIIMILFYKFLKKPSKIIYKKPWVILFFALLVYILEEVFNVLNKLAIYSIPVVMYPIFEMIIISLFIYMLLLQKEYLKQKSSTKKKTTKRKK